MPLRSIRISGYENQGFQNPYPWMSSIEAMVHLELERRQIPFSWRFFDGASANITALMPDYAPEFTLRDYKIVIVVLGNFWGNIPAVLDRTALAFALLEQEGWKCVALYENDIRMDVGKAIDVVLPELIRPAFVGPPRPNPYGRPDIMTRRLLNLRSRAFGRTKYEVETTDARSTRSGRRRRRGSTRRQRAERGTARRQSNQ